MIRCTHCRRDLPLNGFWLCRRNTHRQGRQSWCKDCLRVNSGVGTGRGFDPAPLLGLLAVAGYRSQRTISELCGVTRRTVVRWRSGQPLMAGTADRAATALGLHPSAIW